MNRGRTSAYKLPYCWHESSTDLDHSSYSDYWMYFNMLFQYNRPNDHQGLCSSNELGFHSGGTPFESRLYYHRNFNNYCDSERTQSFKTLQIFLFKVGLLSRLRQLLLYKHVISLFASRCFWHILYIVSCSLRHKRTVKSNASHWGGEPNG